MKRLNCLIFAFLFVFLFLSSSQASAENATVAGKALAGNTNAYLDFNTSPYNSNVTVNKSDGNFSGYGWSEDLGWVVFGTEEGNIHGPVNLNFTSGAVTGKALVISTGAYLDFSGYGSNVVADIAEGVFTGYVWSEDLGWVDFSNTGVTLTGMGFIAGAVPEGLVVIANIGNTPIDISSTPISGLHNIEIQNSLTSDIIVELAIDFTSDINLGNITAGNSATASFFHSSVPITTLTNGGSSDYILYIPKGDGDKVWICPGAASLTDVTLHCSGGYYLSEGQTVNGATASVETVDGTVYWKVSGLTGTGGMSVVTGLKDTLSRLQVSQGSDHTITFGTNNGLTASGHFLVLAFDPSGYDFDLTSLTISDILLTDNVGNDRTIASSSGVNTWGVEIDSNLDTITFFAPTSGTGYYQAASQIVIKIGINAGGINQILNPSTTGSYQETIYILNTDIEGGSVQLPIIDSDRVDITGYVTAYINFDIDTNTDNIDCEYNACKLHSGTTDLGTNYTVDLGELTSAVVNKSQSISSHSDGYSGIINSIYFDITTNAPGGAVVNVQSLNGGLQGPDTNLIESVTDGQDISANSGLYGYNVTTGITQKHGLIVPNILCDTEIEYCGAITLPKIVFTTNNLPVDSARVRMDLAAAANYTNNPGLYTDTLTFIATGTF